MLLREFLLLVHNIQAQHDKLQSYASSPHSPCLPCAIIKQDAPRQPPGRPQVLSRPAAPTRHVYRRDREEDTMSGGETGDIMEQIGELSGMSSISAIAIEPDHKLKTLCRVDGIML
eukprot:1161367-Pelagomonas_calceolata.AAC.4